MLANFLIVQAAPGGPVDLMIARLRGHVGEATARVAGTGASETAGGRLARPGRSEEHTSELQSRPHLVCRLLLEKKNKKALLNIPGRASYSIAHSSSRRRVTRPP